MKTDTLFYRLFQAFPSIFFELIGQPAAQANAYQFTSIELKQQAFRLDGLFLPPSDSPDQPIYLVEVQFQKDQAFYHRFFAEIFLYLYQYQPVNDWHAVVVYARRNLEPDESVPYRLLLASQQVQRVYLDELEETANQSLGVAMVQLIVESEQKTAKRARQLIEQARQQLAEAFTQRQIIELIETIVVYKFPRLSRQELEAMLGLDLFRQTRVYQEAKQEGLEEGEQQGRLAGKLEAVPRFLELGLSLEQVAEALSLEIEVVRQAAQQQP